MEYVRNAHPHAQKTYVEVMVVEELVLAQVVITLV
jgi:hypothetical protein